MITMFTITFYIDDNIIAAKLLLNADNESQAIALALTMIKATNINWHWYDSKESRISPSGILH